MRTDRGNAVIPRGPGVEDAAQAGERRFEIGGSPFEYGPNVNARGRARPAQRDNVLNLREREPEPTGLPDECEQPENLRRIATIA